LISKGRREKESNLRRKGKKARARATYYRGEMAFKRLPLKRREVISAKVSGLARRRRKVSLDWRPTVEYKKHSKSTRLQSKPRVDLMEQTHLTFSTANDF